MSDLRKAAEMALNYFEDAYWLEDAEVAIKEALRKALAEPAATWTLPIHHSSPLVFSFPIHNVCNAH